MGTKWGPNGTKWGPKAEMLIFNWFYKVFGGSDWGPKAKMLIFHWFYKVFWGCYKVFWWSETKNVEKPLVL